MTLEQHEEQIEAILNHLDELPLELIEEMEDKIRGHDDEVVLAHVRISTLEMIIEDIQDYYGSFTTRMAPKRTSTSAAPTITQAAIRKLVDDSVATALEAQAANMVNTNNTNRNTKPREALVERKLFFGSNCIEDCKVKFATGTLTEEALSWWNSFAQPIRIEEAYKITCLTVKGNDLKTYVRRFQELVVLSSKPQTLEEAITITQRLMDQTCNKVGHLTKYYRNKRPTTGSNLLPVPMTCHACGGKEHYKSQCRKTNNDAQGRAYMFMDRNAHQDEGQKCSSRPECRHGYVLSNQHLARVLFDSGADKSVVSKSLASMLNIPPITIDAIYDIEMANGNLVSTNTVIQGAALALLNQPFEIDLMSIKLGSFDVVIGMDWLCKYHAKIL
nr:reverse transcriptase domain-containing protein [Tanacetum cinerariifolium]